MDITGQTYTDDQVFNLTSLLTVASREIQVETGQYIERKEHTWTPIFKPRVRLPQAPNPVVASVKDPNGTDIAYLFDGVEWVYISNPSLVQWDYNVNPFWLDRARATITYTAGYEIVPADIKAICVQMALRAFGADPTKSGFTQEAITNYSYQQGQAAAAGAIGFLPIEKQALSKYRRIVGPISMRGCI